MRIFLENLLIRLLLSHRLPAREAARQAAPGHGPARRRARPRRPRSRGPHRLAVRDDGGLHRRLARAHALARGAEGLLHHAHRLVGACPLPWHGSGQGVCALRDTGIRRPHLPRDRGGRVRDGLNSLRLAGPVRRGETWQLGIRERRQGSWSRTRRRRSPTAAASWSSRARAPQPAGPHWLAERRRPRLRRPSPEASLYRETEHIRRYYELARWRIRTRTAGRKTWLQPARTNRERGMLRKKMSGVAKAPRLSSALQEQAPGTVDRRAFLRTFGPRHRRARSRVGDDGRPGARGAGRSPDRWRQDRHQEDGLHALLGRLHDHGRGAERRVDRPGAGLRQPVQPRRPLRQGCRGRASTRMATGALKYPMKLVGGKWTRISWDVAINEIGDKMLDDPPEVAARIPSTGWARPSSPTSRPICSASSAASGATNNVDHQARICHSTTVAGVANTWGYGAMTNSYNDIHKSKAIFLIGGNPAEAHPVSLQFHLLKAKEQNNAPLIVCDPRFTRTAAHATEYVRFRPGTDVALIWGMLWHIFENGWEDKEFIRKRVWGMDFDPRRGREVDARGDRAGHGRARRAAAAASPRRSPPTSPAPWSGAWAARSTPSATPTCAPTASCSWRSATWASAGGGTNIFRGHDNVQGATDFGVEPATLPGYYGLVEGAWKHWCARLGRRLRLGSAASRTRSWWRQGRHPAVALVRRRARGQGERRPARQRSRRWSSGATRRTRRPAGPTCKKAIEKLDLLVVVDPHPDRQRPCCTTAPTASTCCRRRPSTRRRARWRPRTARCSGARRWSSRFFEAKTDHEIMYLFAKKFGFDEGAVQEHQGRGNGPGGRGHPREINQGACGPSATPGQRRSGSSCTWPTSTPSTRWRCKANGGPCDGDYYGLPWPCWGTAEMKHPGTPNLYDTSKPVAGRRPQLPRQLPERSSAMAKNLLADSCWRSTATRGLGDQGRPSRVHHGNADEAGLGQDLTPEERAMIEKIGGAKAENVEDVDLSGGIQRVAIKHGCAPFGNGKARCVVWNFPDRCRCTASRSTRRAATCCPSTRPRPIASSTGCRCSSSRSRTRTSPRTTRSSWPRAVWSSTRAAATRRAPTRGWPSCSRTCSSRSTRSTPTISASGRPAGLGARARRCQGPGHGAWWPSGSAAASPSCRSTSAATTRARTGDRSIRRAPTPIVLGKSTNTVQTYGYDSVTQMQETKTTLCRLEAAWGGAEPWPAWSSSATPSAASSATPASPPARTSTRCRGAWTAAASSRSTTACPASARSRSPACTARTRPAWRSARSTASTRPRKAWCCTARSCASAAATASTPARSGRPSIRRPATSAAAARWTSAPSAPAARPTTRARSSCSTAATGWPTASCRCVPRCARPRRCWPATATWSPRSTASAWSPAASARVHGAGTARRSARGSATRSARRTTRTSGGRSATACRATSRSPTSRPACWSSGTASNGDCGRQGRSPSSAPSPSGRCSPSSLAFTWSAARCASRAAGRGAGSCGSPSSNGSPTQAQPAGSFVVLAITGVNLMYGRYVLAPIIGLDAFSTLTRLGKYAHNYVGFAFIVGLVLIFVLWAAREPLGPLRLAMDPEGGGLIFPSKHPPAGKFNFGQKTVFWMVMGGGTILAVTGVNLLFPFRFATLEQMQWIAAIHATYRRSCACWWWRTSTSARSACRTPSTRWAPVTSMSTGPRNTTAAGSKRWRKARPSRRARARSPRRGRRRPNSRRIRAHRGFRVGYRRRCRAGPSIPASRSRRCRRRRQSGRLRRTPFPSISSSRSLPGLGCGWSSGGGAGKDPQIIDQRVAVLGLRDALQRHLGAGQEFVRALAQQSAQRRLVPGQTGIPQPRRIVVAGNGAGPPPEQAGEMRPRALDVLGLQRMTGRAGAIQLRPPQIAVEPRLRVGNQGRPGAGLLVGGCEVDDVDRLVGARRQRQPAVGRERHRPHRPAVGGDAPRPLAVRQRPLQHLTVEAAGQRRAAVRRDRHGKDRPAMAAHRRDLGPREGIPPADHAVGARRQQPRRLALDGERGDRLIVRRHAERLLPLRQVPADDDAVLVAGQQDRLGQEGGGGQVGGVIETGHLASFREVEQCVASARDVEQPDCPVPADRGDPIARGWGGERRDLAVVSAQRAECPPGGDVPQHDRAVVAAADRAPSLRQEGDGVDGLSVGQQAGGFAPAVQVPEAHGGIEASGQQHDAVAGAVIRDVERAYGPAVADQIGRAGVTAERQGADAGKADDAGGAPPQPPRLAGGLDAAGSEVLAFHRQSGPFVHAPRAAPIRSRLLPPPPPLSTAAGRRRRPQKDYDDIWRHAGRECRQMSSFFDVNSLISWGFGSGARKMSSDVVKCRHLCG